MTEHFRNRLFLSFLGIAAGGLRSANSADTAEGSRKRTKIQFKARAIKRDAFVFESFRFKTSSMNTFVVHRWWGIKLNNQDFYEEYVK